MIKALHGIAAKRRETPDIQNVAISSYDVKTTTNGSSTIHSLTSVPAGALLVITTACENQNANCTVSSSPVLTWTKRADAQATSSGSAEIHTALFTAGGSITVTSAWGSTTTQDSVCYVIVNPEPTLGGASATGNSQSNPLVNISTTRPNSILFAVTSDWDAINGASRTYRESANTVETSYFRVSGDSTSYHYYQIVPTSSAHSIGLTAPTMNSSGGTAVLEIRTAPPGGPDTEPPSAPVLSTSSISYSSIGLTWTASTDNFGVTGYDVYLNSAYQTTVIGTSTTLSGLTPETSYSIYVRAKDAAGNGTNSNTITPTTTAQPTSGSITYEGFGVNALTGDFTSNGIYTVTNTNASGSGSLANGIASNRTIQFAVGGTFSNFHQTITNTHHLLIDGTTAPSTVVLDAGNSAQTVMSFENSGCNHIVLKGLVFTNAGPDNDGLSFVDGAHDIMISQCTAYNNGDGNLDIAGNCYNVTIQYCIIGNHKPDATNGGNSGGSLCTSYSVTYRNNLFAVKSGDEGERAPLVHSSYTTPASPNADIINNVMWDFGRINATGSGYATGIGYNAGANVRNNYYYTHSASAAPNAIDNNPDNCSPNCTGNIYANGNVSGNGYNINASGGQYTNHAQYSISAPYAVTTVESACDCVQTVLDLAGTPQRNTTEQNFINQVQSYINTNGSVAGC